MRNVTSTSICCGIFRVRKIGADNSQSGEDVLSLSAHQSLGMSVK